MDGWRLGCKQVVRKRPNGPKSLILHFGNKAYSSRAWDLSFYIKPRIVYQNRCQRCLIDSQRSNLQNHILSASISDSEWRKTCFWPSVLLFLASNRGTFQRDHRKGHDCHGHQKLHWRDTDETPHSCGKCCRFCLWGGRSMNLWPTKKLRHLAQNWFATKMVFFSDQRF